MKIHLHSFVIIFCLTLFSQKIFAQAPSIVYSPSSGNYIVGTAITPLNPTNTGGAVTGYTVSLALPSGLTLDATMGTISGTPTAVSTAAPYIVTATNASGSSNFTVTISCAPAPPTVTGGTFCGSGSVTLTASGGLPAGGIYNWYAAASGGPSLATGPSYSPSPATTTTYYADYTQGGVTTSPRVAGTATINTVPVLSTAPTTPTAGLYLSYPFSGNASDASGNANTGTVQGAAVLTNDRYGNTSSAYTFNGSSQYISTAKQVASPGPQSFSISAWFKTSTAGGKLVGYGSSQTGLSGSYDRHIYMNNSGQIYYGIYPGAIKTISAATNYADGNWHHVVATTSTTNGSNLYIDGALQATDITMTTCQSYAGYWRVGYDNVNSWTSSPANFYFTGALDDVAIYNTAITAAQVYSLYGAGSSPVCIGNPLALQVNTVAGATYSWVGPNGFSSATQNPIATSTAATVNAGTYTCTVTGSNGCASTTNVTAVVNALPVSTFTATSPIFVNGSSTITYTGTFSATSAYTWNFSGGTVLTGSGVGPYTVQWGAAGTQTVTLTVTNANGCSSSSPQNVVVTTNTLPTVTGGTFCGSGAVILTASGEIAGGTYNWYAAATGGASLATGPSYSPTPTTTTTYYVDYTLGGVTNTSRTAVTATINSVPVLATAPTMPTIGLYLSYPFNGNANDASGNANNGTVQNAAALANDRYGNANSAYSFNGSTQHVSTTTQIASPGPQNFSISVWFKTSTAGGLLVGFGSSQTGSSGNHDRCIYMDNSGQIYYGIYPGAIKTISTTATYADGNWHHLAATTSTTDGSDLYIDGALQATDITMKTCQPYAGYWRVGYDNLIGWTSTPTDNHFTGSLDDIAIYNTEITAAQVYTLYGAGSPPVCAGNPLVLQANTVAGATYSWAGPNGFLSTSQNPTVTNTAAATDAGTYTCTVTGASGCTSTINVTAAVNATVLPVATFTATSPIFVGGTSTITYTGTFAATSTYVWNFSGGTIISGSGVGPYTVQWNTAGSQIVTLTVTNSSACSSSANQTVVVTNVVQPTVTGGTFCGSGAVVLTASGELAGGTYNWYAAATGGASLATGPTYSPAATTTTTYYVDYTLGGVTTTPRVAGIVTVNSVPVLSTAPATPTGGLYLSYPFSGNSNDASGNSNDGIVQGAAPLTNDRYGNANSAYSLNGSTQYVSTTTLIASPGPQNFSISVWFKTSTAGGMLVGYGSSQTGASGSYDRHIYMSNSGQIYYGIFPGSIKTINTVTTYADGNWHHVVATTSTTAGSNLYVDGALQVTDATMTTCQPYAGYWRIGYNNLGSWTNAPTNHHFTGSLDDIAVYNTAIPAAQVYTLYGGGSMPACAGNALSLQVNTIPGATYSWTGPNSFSSTLQNPNVSSSATTAMAGTYICTVTGPTGCTSTINVTGVVNSTALPVATFTATSPVFTGGSSTITYTGTFSATSTYTWNFNGGTVVSGSGVGPYAVQWAISGPQLITLTVTNSSGCYSSSTQTVTVATTAYGNYAYQDLVTLNTTSLGITSNLASFPALLSIQDNNLIISGSCGNKVVYPNGPNYDFAFVDPGNPTSELNYQIESYNQVTGTLLVWVQVPSLTYAANNSILFCYGSQTPAVTHNAVFFANTWASDYQAVFHFNEANYTGSVTDGTAGGHTGTTSGMTSANLVTGKIGTAYLFSGAQNINTAALSITGTFTISAWVNLSATGTSQKVMVNAGPTGSGAGAYSLGVSATNLAVSGIGAASDLGSAPAPTAFAAGAWHHIQGVYTGATLSTYVDGSPFEVLSTVINPSSTLGYYIGSSGNTLYFRGTIDEARVSNTAKTKDWIKAEYVDQNNPATFAAVGATSTNFTNAAAISGSLIYTWTGLISTNPAVAGNWNNTTAGTTNQLPPFDGSAALVIPAGLINYPSLTANASLYSLNIASGATLNLNGYTLSVACNIYNNFGGQILYGTNNSSGITFNGSATTQTYSGTNAANTAELGSVTINNSAGGTVTISSGPVDIFNTLTITKGNLVVGAAPAALTLKSTATQTANVTAIPAGSSVTGNINVERYLTGGFGYRGYRLISSPVYAATVSSNNVSSLNYLQNSVWLTGTTGVSGGFDKTGNPTIYLYREDQTPSPNSFTGGNFWGISAINNSPLYNYYMNGGATSYNILTGNGVMFFFRGNKASAPLATETQTTYTTPVSVTLVASGALNVGQVSVHDWYTPSSANLGWTNSTANSSVRGYNLVGNPYASSIDWEQYNTTTPTSGIYAHNVSSTIYEFNPATNSYSTYQVGGASTNNGSRTIASGQGFFVLASTSSSPQLIFNESAKVATQNAGLNLFMATKGDVGLINNNKVDQHIRLQMALDSTHTEDIYIGLNPQASPGYAFNEDAVYKPGAGKVRLASISDDNVKLAINKLPLPKLNQTTIPLHIGASAFGTFRLTLTELKEIPELYEVWLMDRFNKDSLDMRHNSTYAFDITADTNSYGSNRFQLVIRQNAALAVHLLDFTAAKTTDGAQVVWKTENEQNYTYFTVERSTDNGATYQVLGGFTSYAAGTYSLLDKDPFPIGARKATDKYRLKIEDLNGTVSYSNVVTLTYSLSSLDVVNSNIVVYPNPATSLINVTINPTAVSLTSNLSTLQTLGITPGVNTTKSAPVYGIKIININGATVINATSSSAYWQGNVGNLSPGTYIIRVVDNTNNSLVGKTAFIKL